MILALIAIGVAGYKYSPMLLPKTDMTVSPDPGCDLHAGTCSATLPGGGRLGFALAPRPIPVTAPLEIQVELEGLQANQLTVDFAGVSMSMGYNRPVLTRSGPGRFTGQTTLPVCVTGRMTWQATVLIETDRTHLAVPFRFDAGK
jgi:hypothetical protein